MQRTCSVPEGSRTPLVSARRRTASASPPMGSRLGAGAKRALLPPLVVSRRAKIRPFLWSARNRCSWGPIRFRRAEEQDPARPEGVVKDGKDPALQGRVEVNEDVPARDEVDLGERRIVDEALRREDHHLAHLFLHPVTARRGGEEGLQPLGRGDVLGDVRGEDPAARDMDRVLVDVGGEDLDRQEAPARDHVLADEDRQRVGLLAAGAAGAPHAQGLTVRLAVDELGERTAGQVGKDIRIAKKCRHADEELVEERRDLGGIGLDEAQIGPRILDLLRRHPSLDPPADRRALVGREVVSGGAGEGPQDLHQRARHLVVRRVRKALRPAQMAEEGRGDLVGRQDEIRAVAGDRAVRHAGEARRALFLDDHQPAGMLDRADAERAVGPGSREHHRDGTVTAQRGEAAKERVDGHARRGIAARFDAQGAVLDRQITGGRRQVDVIAEDRQPVGGLDDRELGVGAKELGHEAHASGLLVGHDHVRQPRIVRRVGEEQLEGFQSARGSSDPHDEHTAGPGLDRPCVSRARRADHGEP